MLNTIIKFILCIQVQIQYTALFVSVYKSIPNVCKDSSVSRLSVFFSGRGRYFIFASLSRHTLGPTLRPNQRVPNVDRSYI